MRIKNILALALALLFALSLVGCAKDEGQPSVTNPPQTDPATTEPATTQGTEPTGFTSDEKFVLGVVLSKTGGDAANGNYCINGVEMAVEEINAAGGINGKEVVIKLGDDQSSAENAVTAFNKVFSENPDMKAVLAPVTSGLVAALEEDITEAKIPALFGATNIALTAKGNKYMFRIRPSDAISATAASKFVVEELKAKNIGILYCNNTFGKGGYEIAKAYLDSVGANVVCVKDHGQDDMEYTAQLLAMQEAGVDVLLCWEIATPSGFISKQIKQLGLDFTVVGSPAWTISDVIATAGGGHEGTYAINDGIPWNEQHPDAEIAAKAAKFFERANGYNNFAAAYYDAVYLVKQAAENAVAAGKTDDPETLVEYLLKIEDYVGCANTFSFDAKGEGVHSATIVQVQDSKPVFIKTIDVE
ncbi:MAG: ABC transporter substrate-binding protein [Eubacteriales bacterium]|nr:ABC transporter substrate-binding protein [Eubacteriales bacterium]